MIRSLEDKYTYEDKQKWKPPHPDLYSPKMWVKNRKYASGHVMVHSSFKYDMGYWEEDEDIDWNYDDVRDEHTKTMYKFYIIIPIDKLQLRHLPHLGPVYDGKRELCYMPWILDYIKKCLDES